jgi:hypothetical protein
MGCTAAETSGSTVANATSSFVKSKQRYCLLSDRAALAPLSQPDRLPPSFLRPRPAPLTSNHRYALGMTAKEKLLEEAPQWTDAQAIAALRVVEAQIGLAEYFDEEAELSTEELDAREDRWAEANAREAVREEPW